MVWIDRCHYPFLPEQNLHNTSPFSTRHVYRCKRCPFNINVLYFLIIGTWVGVRLEQGYILFLFRNIKRTFLKSLEMKMLSKTAEIVCLQKFAYAWSMKDKLPVGEEVDSSWLASEPTRHMLGTAYKNQFHCSSVLPSISFIWKGLSTGILFGFVIRTQFLSRSIFSHISTLTEWHID